MPKTSQINAFRFEEEYNKLTSDGSELVVITISSKLSATYNSAVQASEKYKDKVILSIMNQYTPMRECGFKNLERKLSEKEYDDVIDFCIGLGIEEAYIQEGEAASESFIPVFDGSGVVF